MQIEKTIRITATEKEMQTIGNFVCLFEEMPEDVWDELNSISHDRLGEAITIINDLYDMIEKED